MPTRRRPLLRGVSPVALWARLATFERGSVALRVRLWGDAIPSIAPRASQTTDSKRREGLDADAKLPALRNSS